MSQTVTIGAKHRHIRFDPCDSLTAISEWIKMMDLQLTVYSRDELTGHAFPTKVSQC